MQLYKDTVPAKTFFTNPPLIKLLTTFTLLTYHIYVGMYKAHSATAPGHYALKFRIRDSGEITVADVSPTTINHVTQHFMQRF